jgi:hypothetical protein
VNQPPCSKEQLIEKLKGMSWDQVKQFSSENPGLLTLEEEIEARVPWFQSDRQATRAKV